MAVTIVPFFVSHIKRMYLLGIIMALSCLATIWKRPKSTLSSRIRDIPIHLTGGWVVMGSITELLVWAGAGLMDTWAGVGDQHWCTTTVEVMVVDFMADSMVEVVSMEEEEGNAKPGANEPGFVFVRVMI